MKRLFDLVLSLIFFVLLLPFFILISLFIVFDSRGGIFYKQIRVGKNGKDFYLFKFRTMHTGAEKKGLLTVGKKDARITKTGYYLRRYKLDELPQLLNIIKGDMSIVGPRPEVRKYVSLYTPEQLKVLSVRPGLTDLASLAYINENELLSASDEPEKLYTSEIMPAKLALNMQYIKTQSLGTDIKIIFKTFFKIFG